MNDKGFMAKENLKNSKIKSLYISFSKIDSSLVLVFILLGWVLLLNAWVSDDWYIGLRQIRNFVSGHGVVWNIGERVQTFTCPLWMFFFTPFYWITKEAFLTTLFLQAILAFCLFLVCRKVWLVSREFLFFSALLLLSSGLTDYFTSGTESILSLLIFSFVFGHFFNPGAFTRSIQLFCASLLLLNRLDFLLIVTPWIGFLYFNHKTSLRDCALVFLPAFLWGVFSLVYFGLPLPTTFYSKLTHSVPMWQSLQQGFAYLKVNFVYDPIFVIICIFACLWPIYRKKYEWLGVPLYVAYLVWAGGDFMVARLLTPIYLFGAFALTFELKPFFRTKNIIVPALLSFVLILSLFGVKAPFIPPSDDREQLLDSGVADEKKFYHNKGHSLFSFFVLNEVRDLKFLENLDEFLVSPIHGMRGYYSNEDFYILDPSGIGTPYMLGFPTVRSARVGHYFRRVPLDIVDHFAFHQEIENDQLRKYVQDVKLVIKGDLWTMHRWRAIWRLNTWPAHKRLSSFWSLPEALTPVDVGIEGQGKFYLKLFE